MNRDNILAMEAGHDLDELVGKALKFIPKIQWWAVSGNETGIYCTFDTLHEANDWHAKQYSKFPTGYYAASGGKIEKAEIYKPYSEEIESAWKVVAALQSLKELRGKKVRLNVRLSILSNRTMVTIVDYLNDDVLTELIEASTPLAIAKCAILVMLP